MTDEHASNDATRRYGYAVGYLTDVRVNRELLEYMTEVEATMQRFGGEWLVHGTQADIREGGPAGDFVILRFPDPQAARDWYSSPEYQRIIELRTRNATSVIALLDGVPPGYSSQDTVRKLAKAGGVDVDR